MRVAALISGGKDSCFNMMISVAEGHDIVALANLRPDNKGKDELDSYMYQTVGHHAIDLYAEAMDLPLYVQTIKGSSLNIGRDYLPQEGDEVEDLFQLLSLIKVKEAIEAVSVGAILSDYQRVRVENVCHRLGLKVLAFLWRRNQEDLLKEMIACDLKAIIIKVAAMGLLPDKHLGMSLEEIFPHMLKMKEKYGLHECGEGGEFETFVYDCPLFKKSIVIKDKELVIHSDDAFAPVGYLNLKKCHLQEKQGYDVASFLANIDNLPLLTTSKWKARYVSCPEDFHSPELSASEGTSDALLTDQNHSPPPHCVTDGCSFQVSGISATLENTRDVSTAAEMAMNRLKESIERLGHQLSDLTSVSVYLQSMSDYAVVNAIYSKYFEINPPTRICIQVSLGSNIVFQFDAEGRMDSGEDTDVERRTMHVQSLSHWAPANIGPFSQAIMTGGRLYVSGTTALVPANLSLIEGGIAVESKVSLVHVVEKIAALSPSSSLAHCPVVNCYVTRKESIPVAKQAFGLMLRECQECSADALSPSVQCCVVSKLPKSASVEWQTYAWVGLDSNENVHSTKFTQTYAQYTFTFETSSFRGNFSCTIEVCSTGLGKVGIKDLATELLREYASLMEKGTPMRRGQTSLAKVFYPAGRFSHQDLVESFTQTRADVPVISLVPVTCLETDNHLLVWCQ